MNLQQAKQNLLALTTPVVIEPSTPDACLVDEGSFLCQVPLLVQGLTEASAMLLTADPTTWKTPARILAFVLETAFAGELVFGTNLFVGHQPDNPNIAITLYDSGGPDQQAKLAEDTHFIQITCRHDDYQQGYNLLNQVKALLQSMPRVAVDGEMIVGIWVLSNIAYMGRDRQNAPQFTSNYRVIIDTNKNLYREP